jgi:hypothetical protein
MMGLAGARRVQVARHFCAYTFQLFGGYMPKTLGGWFGWLFMTVIVVAVGIFILSRTPLWMMILPKSGA